MGNKTWKRVFAVIMFFVVGGIPSATFAETHSYTVKDPNANKFTTSQIKQRIDNEEQLKRKAATKMTKSYREQTLAQGELNRAKKGEVGVRDVVKYGAVGLATTDQDTRIQRAQERYGKAKEQYQKDTKSWQNSVYQQGRAKIWLDQKDSSKK